MWALRRTANHLRVGGEYANALRACANLMDGPKCNECSGEGLVTDVYVITRNISCASYQVGRGFSTCVRATASAIASKKKENKDEEESFSELDEPAEEASLSEGEIAEALSLTSASEDEALEGEECEAQADPYLSEVEEREEGEGEAERMKLLQDIINCRCNAVPSTLDRWVGDGNVLRRKDAAMITNYLRRRRMYERALQISEWLWETKPFMFNEADYGSQLDLIAKQLGISRAEKYFEAIPTEMRGYEVYRTLLANYSYVGDMKKAEGFLKKMKDAGFSLSIFDYNSLLVLYRRIDRRKISNVLEMMEHENIIPDSYTYKNLIDAKGAIGDIVGMEQIVEIMKAECIQSDHITIATLATLAKHYIGAGYMKKAEALMKELESNGTAKYERYILKILLPLYADIDKVSEVERVWNVFESFPKIFIQEYIAGIYAWGKLGKIEKAEIIFEKVLNTRSKIASSKAYNGLLKIYADHYLLLKAKDLVKRIPDNGIRIDPITVDALVNLYVKSGDVEKADAVLFKVCNLKQVRPQYKTFIAVLDKYAEKGDIANAEKIFDRMTSFGYGGSLKSYECLLQAYLKAHIPAYGFKERMLGAKLYPNRRINNILQQVGTLKKDASKKDLISEILD